MVTIGRPFRISVAWSVIRPPREPGRPDDTRTQKSSQVLTATRLDDRATETLAEGLLMSMGPHCGRRP